LSSPWKHKKDDSLPFLDVLVTKEQNGTLGRTVYRKPIHMDLYLHAESHHHPSQKHAVLASLINWAKTVYDTESLNSEIQHIKVFRHNGYSRADFNRAVYHENKTTAGKEKAKATGVVILPFQHTTSYRISRLLGRFNIKAVHIPFDKTGKGRPRTECHAVYSISCECVKVYVGPTGRSVETRCKEHTRYLCLYQLDKSAVAERSIGLGRQIKFKNTEVLPKTARYMDRIVKEAIESRLDSNNINQEEGYKLSKAWNPAINILINSHTDNIGRGGQKEQRKKDSKD
jgi:hypothetical protein